VQDTIDGRSREERSPGKRIIACKSVKLMRKSKNVHGFTRHFFKMLLPGSSASYGPHVLKACEGTTLGINDSLEKATKDICCSLKSKDFKVAFKLCLKGSIS
jgi:hypothetical protein